MEIKSKNISLIDIEFIKDSIDPTNEAIFLQNLEFLKSSLISKELKYFNAYVTKLLGKQPITYFDYDENEQYQSSKKRILD